MADNSLFDIEQSGIYRIINTENEKCYVGSAKCFRIRWGVHRRLLLSGKHHSPHLQGSWNKHGESKFSFEILEFCHPEVLIVREQFWIDELEPDFNVCPKAGSTLGRKLSKETKKKISDKAAGRKLPPRSEACRKNISKAHAGKKKPRHVMEALQAGRKRQIYTEERLARVSSSLKLAYETGKRSRQKTEEHKNKIGMFYATLTDGQVKEIRKLKIEGFTCKQLAERFNSNPGTISEICTGKRYKWVT
jgi:group I intron endonuclease